MQRWSPDDSPSAVRPLLLHHQHRHIKHARVYGTLQYSSSSSPENAEETKNDGVRARSTFFVMDRMPSGEKDFEISLLVFLPRLSPLSLLPASLMLSVSLLFLSLFSALPLLYLPVPCPSRFSDVVFIFSAR